MHCTLNECSDFLCDFRVLIDGLCWFADIFDERACQCRLWFTACDHHSSRSIPVILGCLNAIRQLIYHRPSDSGDC